MSAVPERYIDFHAHLFPDDFFDAIWAFFRREYGLEVAHRLYARECIDFLRERGAGAVVYSNYAHRKGVARTLNEWNIALLESTAGLSCFAPFHPDDDDALAMARDILQHPQVLGFKLHFLVQPFRPDDESLFPLYELVMERGKRLLMHIGTGPIGNGRVGAAYLERILERYPCLPANIAHMGAFEFGRFFSLLEGHPGHAPEQIARIAARERSGLIVMGSHGHSALGSAVLGSVAQGVLARCKTPVMFIR